MPAARGAGAPPPVGRPPKLDTTVAHRADGSPISAADRITNAIAIGCYFEQACAAAGVGKTAAYGWLKAGAEVHRGVDKGTIKARNLSAHQRRCAAFANAVAQAEAQYELDANTVLEQLARGGTVVTTVTEKVNARGQVIETSTRTETMAPSPQVIEWRLTRRFPTRYSQRVELTGADGGPIELSSEERATQLAEAAEAYLAGHRDGSPSTNGASTNGQG